jgi:hypothetical protein
MKYLFSMRRLNPKIKSLIQPVSASRGMANMNLGRDPDVGSVTRGERLGK